MVVVIVLAIVLIFVPLLLWGVSRARSARAGSSGSSDGRGSNRVVGVVFAFIMLGFGIALPLAILEGNSSNASAQIGGVKLTADAKQGRIVFGEHCAVCHTLGAANAIGKVGPNLDLLKPPKSLVLHTLANGCLPNAAGSDASQACLGQGVMDSEIVIGRQAEEVASFVAEAAGH